jgi:hypothetical protein
MTDTEERIPIMGSSETEEKERALKRKKEMESWFWDKTAKPAKPSAQDGEAGEAVCSAKPLLLCCLTFAAPVVCDSFCIPCLLAIFAVSACTCPFVPVMNVPLWSAIIILVYEGWTLTDGRFGVFWGGV